MSDVRIKDLQKDEEAKESDLRKQLEEIEPEITKLGKEENNLILEISVADKGVKVMNIEKVLERWNEGLDAEIARIEKQISQG